MKQITPVFKREFLGYFRSPVAYVFLVVFLLASVGCAFFLGGFFRNNSASIVTYFFFLPWLFLFLIPAAGMRLWSEEKRSGTVELLFTLPITTLEAVFGKFLAAWSFITVGILLSFPMVLTILYLGQPDFGVTLSGYLGSILMASAYLGICSCVSAITKNQIVSFVISVFICLILALMGHSVFTGFMSNFLPVWLVDVISNFSFIPHFEPFVKGIIDPKDVMFFVSLTGFTLFLNIVALER